MRTIALSLALACLAAGEEGEKEAPPVREIRVDEAVDLGLALNLGLKSARLGALMQRLSVDAAEAGWDATLTSSISAGETLLPSRSSLSGADVVDSDNLNFALGVTKPFRVGPSLGVTWRTDRTFTNSSFSTINPSYDTALDVALTVPLLRGRGRAVQESDLRASRAGAEGARLDLVDEASRLVDSIAAAFWNLVYLQDRVNLLEKSVQVAREIEATERRKLQPDIGRSTILDVTQAKAQTKRREAALIQGRRDAANAADDLRALILPFDGGEEDETRLRANGAPRDTVEVPPLETVLKNALASRPDLNRGDADIRRLEEAVLSAKNALRVQLDLVTGVTWRGVSRDHGNSVGDTIGGKTPSAFAAFNLTWPVGRRAARHQLRRAELELEQARVKRLDQVGAIIAEVRSAYRTLQTAIQEIGATREEVRAAEASLEGERQRLARGSSTVLEVARLEEDLTEAQLRLLRGRTDLEQARVVIERVGGTVLERFGVSFDSDLKARRR